ncbi:hypothetical protein TNCV_4307461 [Trichonephila clavipes]|nr:hypothetical protein TNCV_4307461 [Trichonephila clavipes]
MELRIATGTPLGSCTRNVIQTGMFYITQFLQPEEYPLRGTFATWFLQQSATDSTLAASIMFMDKAYIMFMDKAYFTHKKAFNQHNTLEWALENPHHTQPCAAQQHFPVNVWASILGD